MNTSELVRQLANQLRIPTKQARQLLEQELGAIGEQLEQGKDVIIRGFGKFSLRPIRSTSNNPVTNSTVTFRAARKFRDFVKGWRP